MNSRERVLAAVNHQVPDRPPIFVTVTPQVAGALTEHLGWEYEEPMDSLLSTRISHTKMLTRLGNDCVGVAACVPDNKPSVTSADGVITNEWGMRFKTAGLYNEFCEYPLAHAETVKDVDNYAFPDPFAVGRFREAEKAIAAYRNDFCIVGDLETTIFETAWYLTGLEKFLVDLVSGAAYVEKLLDRILEINLETGKELIRLGADIIWAGDDFGTQRGMIMDPALWRKVFRPRIRFLFEEFRKVNNEIKIAWHCCGSIPDIIPDFIEIGLDILNPLQPKARGMDPESLVNKFGRDLVFFGGIDIQELIPKGTPGQIKEEVRRICGILGRHGGYIVAPAHNIQPDTPIENIFALFAAVKEF